ncbi:hypothetical protein MF672_045690 [Actinomadura sp. ATCC 31491]|uniref:DUF2079 domain-containing protein n=1 Tax=Actinomadura luzonensis TaxID=2805427 RepID=A0ABT0G8X1_9ACTN|nr:hypothetical protein [Actinomadura luzonensis]MCK2221049.1 hypothetical protein [Actinomadura luzonensis]
MPRTPRAGLVAALLGLVLGCLALGPGLGPGFVLLHDMVFVPDPEFSAWTFGLAGGAARVVPSDALVTALAQVLPAELVQKAILLGIFVLGCSGAAALAPAETLGLGPRLVAGAFYVWNPYVAERLLIGQWALLLGYAGLPWAVRAVWRGRRRALAVLPAAAGGFAAMTVTALTALPVALTRGRRAAAVTAGVLVALSLPWLVVTALRPEGLAADPVGVEAFAARADTPFGAVGSLLSLGGIWNANAVPPGYGTWAGALARILLVVVGWTAFLRSEPPFRRGLAAAAVAGVLVACVGVSEPGREAYRQVVGWWGGFAVFRDAQQFVAPLALAAALGLGALTQRVAGGRAWVAAMAVVPVAVLPTMAWGALGTLEAVPYPRSWSAARAVIEADPAPGDVLVLPFEAYRRFPWNAGRPVLDPAQRFFAVPGRRVVSNDAVRVGDLVVENEDPRAAELERVLEGSSPDLAGAGIRYVIVDAGTVEERARFDVWLRRAHVLVQDRDLRLYRLDEPTGR